MPHELSNSQQSASVPAERLGGKCLAKGRRTYVSFPPRREGEIDTCGSMETEQRDRGVGGLGNSILVEGGREGGASGNARGGVGKTGVLPTA